MSDHIEKYMRKVGDSPSIADRADYEQLKRRIATLEAQLQKAVWLFTAKDASQSVESLSEWITRRDALLAKIKENKL